MKKIKRLILTFAVILALIVPGGAALADQADPDATPTATFYAFRNLLETGDYLLYILANIPYTSIPDDDVTQAFVWRLIDTDNSTELGSTTGFVFQSSGYGYNVYSMYWAAASAPTWLTAYPVRLSGNPAVFDTPPTYNFQLDTSDYSSQTVQTTVQAELASRIITDANFLGTQWGLSASDDLITSQETGTVLSLNGEVVFRGSIFGVQAMAPTAFSIVQQTITATDRTWTDAYSTNVSTQHAGTWVETAQTGGADMFQASYDLLSVMLVLVLCGLAIAAQIYLNSDAYAGVIDAALVAVLLGRLGLYEMSALALLAAIAWLFISAKTWGLAR